MSANDPKRTLQRMCRAPVAELLGRAPFFAPWDHLPPLGCSMLLFLHDFRRLIEASTAAVENQSHKTAADQKGKEDTETHHQPAPRRHDHVASRFPPVVATHTAPARIARRTNMVNAVFISSPRAAPGSLLP